MMPPGITTDLEIIALKPSFSRGTFLVPVSNLRRPLSGNIRPGQSVTYHVYVDRLELQRNRAILHHLIDGETSI